MKLNHEQRKRKFKKWLSAHGGFVMLGSVIFILFGLVCMIVGFYLSGADILGWFTSRWAFLLYAAIIVWLFGAGALWYWGKLGNNGR